MPARNKWIRKNIKKFKILKETMANNQIVVMKQKSSSWLNKCQVKPPPSSAKIKPLKKTLLDLHLDHQWNPLPSLLPTTKWSFRKIFKLLENKTKKKSKSKKSKPFCYLIATKPKGLKAVAVWGRGKDL